jgi:hypothetical protein
MYSEWASDPKVQRMSECMQRRLMMLFCARCDETIGTLRETDLAFHWRISEEEIAATKVLFIEKGFIDAGWRLLNWNKRQFISDVSTERVRKHRQARKQCETLHETIGTAQNRTEQNRTDAEQNKESSGVSAMPERVRKHRQARKQCETLHETIGTAQNRTEQNRTEQNRTDAEQNKESSGVSAMPTPTPLARRPTQPHSDLTTAVNRIILAHPRSLLRQTRWNEVKQSQVTAVLDAMQSEVEAHQVSPAEALEGILQAVTAHAEAATPEDYQFFKDVENYFGLREYRTDPSQQNRKDRPNGTAKSKTAHTIDSAKAAIEIIENRRVAG